MTITRDEALTLARAIQGTNNGYSPGHPLNKLDDVAYAAVATMSGDAVLAASVCDQLTDEYVRDHMTEPTLPRLRPEPVWVDGEWLERPARYFGHGTYVYAADEGKWYMAVADAYSGTSWNAQAPFQANRDYFRREAAARARRAIARSRREET